MKKSYITTSIAYTNAPPHIGHALELVQADVVARYLRKKNQEVFFLTGTDEHGIKIFLKAQQEKKQVSDLCQEISGKFQDLTKKLNISNDSFIRTTDQKKHWPGVFKMWQSIEKDLYLKDYQGLYCVGCEAFILEKDLVDGKCPLHDKEPEKNKESNYFFKLSKYSSQIKEAIEKETMKIVPQSRKNEILNFINQGLKDVSFSRPKEKVQWGIPVPKDESQLIYCWADALTNYLSAINYGIDEKYQELWPADVHFIGKDISKFHALIWPGMLLSAGLELPKTIFVHGFLTVDGRKMSKSLGNVIDPLEVIDSYGAEALRYYLLSEISPTEDGDFSWGKFKEKYKADLVNGIGNLTARIVALIEENNQEPEKEIVGQAKETREKWSSLMEEFKFNSSLNQVMNLVSFTDRYIDQKKPWQDKNPQVISNLIFLLEEIADMLSVFLPETSERILNQINKREKEILFKKID